MVLYHNSFRATGNQGVPTPSVDAGVFGEGLQMFVKLYALQYA